MTILKSSKGNVLFLILIAVALFAALSYAVSSSFRGGTNTISDEQARVEAGELLRSMQSIKQGYQYLWTQQGCSIDEISFIKAGKAYGADDYDALTPKSDDSCDVFATNGAGIAYPEGLNKYQTETTAANTGDIFLFNFQGNGNNNAITNLGTTTPEHIVALANLQENICISFNKLLNIDDPENFTTETGTLIVGDEDTRFSGAHAGCIKTNTLGYAAYFVLQEF